MPACDLVDVTRLVLGLTFASAGTLKWRTRPRETSWAPFKTAWPRLIPMVVAGEMVLAFWLVSGFASEQALPTVTLVLAGFTTYIIVALRRGESSGCRCFGAIDTDRLGATQLVRNVGLFTGAAAASYLVVVVGCGAGNSVGKFGIALALFVALGAIYLLAGNVEELVSRQQIERGTLKVSR